MAVAIYCACCCLPSACLQLDSAASPLHLAVWLSPYAGQQPPLSAGEPAQRRLFPSACGLAYYKEWLAEFYALTVFYKDLFYSSCKVAFNLVHQLHCFYNCQYLTFFYAVANFYERKEAAAAQQTPRRKERRSLCRN